MNQEAEANRFAIELLAPPNRVRRYLRGVPDLDMVLELAKDFDLSREATARRYVELHDRPSAVIFARAGKVRYSVVHREFPGLNCRPEQNLPAVPVPSSPDHASGHEDADPRDWLRSPKRESLAVQTLSQSGGYAMALLVLDDGEGDQDGDEGEDV